MCVYVSVSLSVCSSVYLSVWTNRTPRAARMLKNFTYRCSLFFIKYLHTYFAFRPISYNRRIFNLASPTLITRHIRAESNRLPKFVPGKFRFLKLDYPCERIREVGINASKWCQLNFFCMWKCIPSGPYIWVIYHRKFFCRFGTKFAGTSSWVAYQLLQILGSRVGSEWVTCLLNAAWLEMRVIQHVRSGKYSSKCFSSSHSWMWER